MKTSTCNIRNILLASLMCALTAASHAQLQWDPALTPATPSGGAGTWDAANVNWSNGAVDSTWNSATAVFGGTAGPVSVTGTQSVTGLTFNTTGYTLQGAGTINFTGTPTISGIATINTTLTGTSGMTLQSGSKTIGGNNTGLTGLVTVTGAGSSFAPARIANNNALGSSSLFADRVNIVQGAQGAALQLNSGIVLPKYITTTGIATIETITGNTSLTGNLVPGGTLLFSLAANTNLTLSGASGLGQSGSSVQATGSGRLIVDATASATAYGLFIRNSAAVQVNSGFSVGPANIFFDGAAGNTTLALNGSTVANNVFIGAATSAKIENMAAGSSIFSGQLLNNGANYSVMLRSTTSGTLNVTGNINDSTFSGAVSIGNGNFTNSGVVNLSRASGNTYDGGTIVNSGTLVVSNTSGSATGTGSVTVNSGATLGGNGTISGNVIISSGGTLAAGNSPGILNTGNLTMGSGSTLAVELNSITAGTGYDQVNVTGAVTLGGNLTISLGFTPVQFDNFFIVRNDGADAITGLINGYAQGSSFSLGGFEWLISYTGDFGGNTFTGGNDLVIQAVPEPSAAFMLLFGALSVGLLVRNRRRSAANASR